MIIDGKALYELYKDKFKNNSDGGNGESGSAPTYTSPMQWAGANIGNALRNIFPNLESADNGTSMVDSAPVGANGPLQGALAGLGEGDASGENNVDTAPDTDEGDVPDVPETEENKEETETELDPDAKEDAEREANRKDWEQKLLEAAQSIYDRKDFEYDPEKDELYKSYAGAYSRAGEMAMRDTVGKSAALTGGYGNSYAQTAGQQVYGEYMDELSDKIPELWQAAYDRYDSETDSMYDKLSMAAQMVDFYGEDKDKTGDKVTVEDTPGDDDNENTDETTFSRYEYAGTDSYGVSTFYKDGKKYTYQRGINPYTNTINPDAKNDKGRVDKDKVFSNGYQPNNVDGKKLTESGVMDYINGVMQNVWMDTDGNLWIWDDTQNKYLKYEY